MEEEKQIQENQAPVSQAPISAQSEPLAQPAAIQPQPAVANQVPAAVEKSPAIRSVERVTVWIMVLSAIMFALISILAIWGVLGDANGEILGRSLGTIAVIAFTSLVINVGANMLDRSKKN